ncbi:MAG: hypothetical protein RL489_2256 [Pseudomonadota bacterium]|jgi:hypothetical protein
MRLFLAALVVSGLAGCAGKVDYIRPTTQISLGQNTKLIQKPRDAVWATSVPALSKQFFVINNLDKTSGLINLSYSGDPEKYIDCGRITSFVKNAQGERTYDFAGAKAQQSYEIMNPGVGLFFLDRRMSLEGRVNLIFEEVDANTTRVTANTRYVVNRTQIVRSAAGGFPQSSNDSISFNSGGSAPFPANQRGEFAECAARGVLEQEVLSAVQ